MTGLFLLDTHIVLWATSDPDRLSISQREILEDPGNALMISTISVAEIEIKRAIGKLEMPHDCDELRVSLAADYVPLMAEHAAALRTLPNFHRDPFDRLLIAQALVLQVPLVSSDGAVARYRELLVDVID